VDGGGIPDVLLNRPLLYLDLEIYWDAFIELSRTRSIGFVANPINITDISNYLDFLEIYVMSERREYVKWIWYLDSIYMKYLQDTENSKRKN
jgi:hypothetical protein